MITSRDFAHPPAGARVRRLSIIPTCWGVVRERRAGQAVVFRPSVLHALVEAWRRALASGVARRLLRVVRSRFLLPIARRWAARYPQPVKISATERMDRSVNLAAPALPDVCPGGCGARIPLAHLDHHLKFCPGGAA